MPGYDATTSSASSISGCDGAPNDVPRRHAASTAAKIFGWAWPKISGPQEPTKSKYSRPSMSTIVAALAERITSGVPPTLRNARTGELTPPGMTFFARSNQAAQC